MWQSGRQFSSGTGYRYGFNGKENDNEVKGEGNQQDYGFRIYDPRLGRFLSVDPLTRSYPMLTPYAYAENQPIWAIDIDGLEKYIVTNKYSNGHLREVRLQATYEKETKKYVNMQFKYANGNRVTMQDIMVINKYYRDGKLQNDNFAFADKLTKDQNKLLNSTPKVPLGSGQETEYSIDNHPEIQPASFNSDGLAEVDGIKRIPLIQNLKPSFNNSSFFYASPATGQGSLLPKKDVWSNEDKEFYDLPSKIKEDGGIKSIDITLTYYVHENVNDKDFANLQKAFGQVANQVKEMYLKSGIKNVNVNPVIERRSDAQQANVNTPDVQINLKR